jgi:predicted peroxiredoxin
MTGRSALQVIIVSGPGDAGRALTGLSLAAAAAACGTRVVVFLAGEGARWLGPDTRESAVGGFATVAELLNALRANGGVVEVCSNCVHDACRTGAAGLPGAATTGLATVALRLSEIPTVVF